MAISAGQIVQVLPRILRGTGTDLVFNGLVLSKNSSLASGVATAFSSASAVGEFFGTASDEYQFASVYFGGYTGSQLKPSALYFYRYSADGATSFLRGGALNVPTVLATIRAITEGSLTFNLDGAPVELTKLNFSGATSFSAVADILQTAIRKFSPETAATESASAVFDPVQGNFVITNGSEGEEHTMDFGTGDVAEVLALTKASGAVVSVGTDAQSLTDAMNACVQSLQNFVTYTTLWQASNAEALELGKWASTNANSGVMYLYVVWDSSKANLNATATGTIADELKENSIGATTVVYPDYKVAAFTMGTTASINWDAREGTLTFAFRAQDGLAASVQSTEQHTALLGRNVNFIGNYASRNDNFVFFYNGSMLGDWSWIDSYLNAVWLCNALQVQIMSGFQSVRRVPYTESGYAIIRSWCRDVITRALNNGVIDTGVGLSETQISALTQDLGGDYSQEISNNGYYLQVEDVPASSRQQRSSPACNLVYTYSGAIHKLNLPAIAVV